MWKTTRKDNEESGIKSDPFKPIHQKALIASISNQMVVKVDGCASSGVTAEATGMGASTTAFVAKNSQQQSGMSFRNSNAKFIVPNFSNSLN
jgi:hypothetical protein